MNNEDIGCSIGLENENDLFLWNVIFEGPTDTLYEVRILAFAVHVDSLMLCSFSGWLFQSSVKEIRPLRPSKYKASKRL